MSSTFSAESAASASDLNEPECEPSRSAKSTHIAAPFSESTGQMSLFTATCEPLPQRLWLGTPRATQAVRSEAFRKGRTPSPEEFVLMSSAAVSRVKISATPARALALPASVRDYGKSTPELLARYDRDTSSWRTSQHCFIEGLETFSETFPRSGIVVAGTVFLPVLLERRTDETECGS